jgi:hypothetical protein
MVSEEAKANTKGAKAFVAQTCFLVYLKPKFQYKQWGLEWEEKDETPRGRAPFEQGGTKGKVTIKVNVRNIMFRLKPFPIIRKELLKPNYSVLMFSLPTSSR